MPERQNKSSVTRRRFWPAMLVAVWVGISTTFTVGAGFENAHAVAFAFYAGGTVAGLLIFVVIVVAVSREGRPE